MIAGVGEILGQCVDPQGAGAEQADDVPAQPFPLFVGQERAVAVAGLVEATAGMLWCSATQ